MYLRISLSVLLLASWTVVTAQTPELASVRMYVREMIDGQPVCRIATPTEAKLFEKGAAPVHVIYPVRGRVSQATGLRITLLATDQLEANPTAKAAFVRAAQIWEALIGNPVSATIKVDFGLTRFGVAYPGPTILGSASGVDRPVTYEVIRDALVARADTPAEIALYNQLPLASVPTDLGQAARVLGTVIQLRTLGFPIPDDPFPNVGFNSAFPFDFDPSNGIDADKTDFEAVTVHELGHVLGFGSSAGSKELNPGEELTPTIFDLFRFRPGATLATFQAAQRPMSSGGTHVHFGGGNSIQMSTGRPDGTGGDGQQSSHWKDDTNGNPLIGLMDPTVPDGFRGTLNQTDKDAFDVMGYTIVSGPSSNPPPSPPSNLTATGTSSTEIRLNWQDNSSNETEFRIEQRNGSGVFIDAGSAAANATTINILNFTAGQSATFRVRARNATGDSAYSNEATGTTTGEGSSVCVPSATTVCLLSDRFRVSVAYVNPFSNPPNQPGTFLTARLLQGVQNPDTALFGFSSAQAVEVVVRIQDTRPFAPRFDVYYGGMTDVEYTVSVTDTQTGVVRQYKNNAGTVGGGVDRASFPTSAFGPSDRMTSGGSDTFFDGSDSMRSLIGHGNRGTMTGERGRVLTQPGTPSAGADEVRAMTNGPAAPCVANSTTVCLLGDRFRVSIAYVNPFSSPPNQPGTFLAARLLEGVQNPDTALFGFSSAQAVEVVVRVQDTRPFAPRFDLYYGGMTDVEYTVSVTDTQTGVARVYKNNAGQVGGGVDRSSFPTN